MQESPAHTRCCVLAPALVGEHFCGQPPRINAWCSLNPLHSTSDLLPPSALTHSPSVTMYVSFKFVTGLFLAASFVAPALSAPVGYVDPNPLIYSWHHL
jgi:hypothetical protein